MTSNERTSGQFYKVPENELTRYAPDWRPQPVLPEGIELPLTIHQVGEQIMWPTRLEQFGDQTTVTAGDLAELADSNGRCALLEYIAHPELQDERFGREMVRTGPWPEGETRVVPDSDQWYDQRAEVFQAAKSMADSEQRSKAIAAALRLYGVEYGSPSASDLQRILARTYGFGR